MTPAPTSSLIWLGDAGGVLEVIDQTQLPGELRRIVLNDVGQVWEAIQSLRVRGAPLIGIAAAYGLVLGMQPYRHSPPSDFRLELPQVAEYLASCRPTAVNLRWAIEQLQQAVAAAPSDASSAQLLEHLFLEARRLHEEDRAMCHAIGEAGAELFIGSGWRNILTHCNTGGLATSEYGTALAVIFTMQDKGAEIRVYAGETRPLLQGARLTAWELAQRNIPTTLICDSMAAQLMRDGRIDVVITGADRIAANGDTANKIGTYGLAVLARAHGIPFYVAAPSSTFDPTIDDGDQIPIEQRDPAEVTHIGERALAPDGIEVHNPAFDLTPADYIEGIITDRGIIRPVTMNNLLRTIGVA
jgi:methylthioribose-1-phosphate isomerase